jgi:hypothetical protein
MVAAWRSQKRGLSDRAPNQSFDLFRLVHEHVP